MGLLSSIFQRSEASSGASYREGITDELVAQTRTRARNRLIGALVLVIAGVVALPMLFDSEPRSLPGTTRIDVAKAPQDAPAPAPSQAAVPGPQAEPRAAEPAPVPTRAAAPAVVPVPESRPEPVRKPAVEEGVAAREPREARPAPKPAAAVARKESPPHEAAAPHGAARNPPGADERARALLEGRDGASDRPAAAAAGAGRFVVQVAAYADQASLGQARGRVHKLGLRTYTQSVKTEAGPRIRLRIGPFTDRADAERVLDRIKAAGLPGSVLAL